MCCVQAYRLLAEEQYKRGWDYPLHLGVTGGCCILKGQEGVCIGAEQYLLHVM